MNDDRYNKHYFKILNNTITETILRNIQMQAQAEFVDELVGELQSENESLRTQIQELGDQLKEKIEKIGELNTSQVDIDNVKHQLQHLETFKSELGREREEHSKSLLKIMELENKITELQSPKKIRKVAPKSVLPIETTDGVSQDGGTF